MEEPVRFRGQDINPKWGKDWPVKWSESQKRPVYMIDGVEFMRVPFHSEHGAPCPFCAANNAELHLVGCEEEKCPKCFRKVATCGCLQAWRHDG